MISLFVDFVGHPSIRSILPQKRDRHRCFRELGSVLYTRCQPGSRKLSPTNLIVQICLSRAALEPRERRPNPQICGTGAWRSVYIKHWRQNLGRGSQHCHWDLGFLHRNLQKQFCITRIEDAKVGLTPLNIGWHFCTLRFVTFWGNDFAWPENIRIDQLCPWVSPHLPLRTWLVVKPTRAFLWTNITTAQIWNVIVQ